MDQGNLTAQRGQDVTARTSIATNTADNIAAMERRRAQDQAGVQMNDADNIILRQNNVADNARALDQTRLTNTKDVTTSMLAPVGEGQTRFVPPSIASMYGVPDQQIGAVAASPGEQVTLPNHTVIAGTPIPLSETEWQAQQNERLRQSGALTDDTLLNAVMGAKAPVESVDKLGKPIYVSPGEAVRNRLPAFEKGPDTVVNLGENGVNYGSPGDGLAWARTVDGKVKLDERGAPIAVPFQGGKVYQAQIDKQKADASKTQSEAVKQGIVLQDLDRALDAITSSPSMTTGLAAQLTAGIGDTPARNVNGLLDTVRANIGFDQLQQMRDASPTGGALGQVTERELQLLQSVLGSIDTTQNTGQVQDNLRRLKNTYLDIVHGPRQGPARERLSFEQRSEGEQPGKPVYALNPRTGEKLVLRHGAWEPAQ